MTSKMVLAAAFCTAPIVLPALAAEAPQQPYGVQSGDVTSHSAIIWGRSDIPARMFVEVSPNADFSDARLIVGPAALENTDYTAKVDVDELPAGSTVHYRVTFTSLEDTSQKSAPIEGVLHTAPVDAQDIRFVWSGDLAGQGWGINEDFGGYTIFDAMKKVEPQFFLNNGDTIYADGPIKADVSLDDGSTWHNLTTPGKSKVAETLDEFRGAYRYNLMDKNLRAFNAAVPLIVQWDDHETLNNWYPQEVLSLDDDRYSEKSVALLSARAKQAFTDYQPIRYSADDEKIYRKLSYGPLMDMIVVDMRTYRGPNSPNLQTEMGPDTAFMGKDQVEWIKKTLSASKATWKVIAADMPIGLLVRDGKTDFENLANGDDGKPLGRELEFADLLSYIKANNIENVVFLTADVHYAAAHYYDPQKAQFKDFLPFWEFVAGPLNAGTFGPNGFDHTFGPELKFVKAPAEGQANLPPSAGLQFFGQVDIDAKSEVMTVALKDLSGATLYSVELQPAQ